MDNKGWVCPVCGRGVAPWKDHCDCIEFQPQSPFMAPYRITVPYGPHLPYDPYPWPWFGPYTITSTSSNVQVR